MGNRLIKVNSDVFTSTALKFNEGSEQVKDILNKVSDNNNELIQNDWHGKSADRFSEEINVKCVEQLKIFRTLLSEIYGDINEVTKEFKEEDYREVAILDL